MAYIERIAEQHADNHLKQIYAAARSRAGGVANIINVMSRDLAVLDGSMLLFFNYINRIADGLGVDPEDWMEPGPEEWRAKKGRRYEEVFRG